MPVSAISFPDLKRVWFWWKLGFRQHFGFIFSIPIFCKNTKGDGGSGGGGGGGGSGGGLGCW